MFTTKNSTLLFDTKKSKKFFICVAAELVSIINTVIIITLQALGITHRIIFIQGADTAPRHNTFPNISVFRIGGTNSGFSNVFSAGFSAALM